jgi:Right handed beta helix region
MAQRTLKTFALLLVAALSGCGGHLGDLVGPPPRPEPPIRPPSAAPKAGLLALCAGDNIVRVDYRKPSTGFEGALFLGTDTATLFSGAPVVSGLVGDADANSIFASSTHPIVSNGTTLFVGFGIRKVGTTGWTKIGEILQCRPGAPLYIDLNQTNTTVADGSTPALALPLLDESLLIAALLASFEGTKNVWVSAGVYSTRPFNAGVPGSGVFAVGSGVHVYGGFAPGAPGSTSSFDIAARTLPPENPTAAESTILRGNATPRILDVISGGAVHIVDGIAVDGQSTIVKGVDVSESDVEMRSVRIRLCTDNGLQIKQITDFVNRRRITLTACEVSQSGNDGIGLAGNFALHLDRSDISANGGRGIDPNDLQALSGSTAILSAFGCRFYGNTIDGLGMDLNTIATQPPAPGGRYEIDIEGCSFERNGRDGLFVDLDYDLFPEWYTRVRIRDCVANANRRAGIHIDADDKGEFVIDRVRCTANGGDGLWISSEPDDPATTADDGRSTHIVVTNSSMLGNLGWGIQANEGDKIILASHCALAGNQLGGFQSMLTGPRGNNPRRISSAVNFVIWRQPTPFVNVRATSCWIESADNPFVNAPAAYAVVNANQSGALTLAANSSIAAGDAVEIGDDGVKLTVTSSTGGSLVVNPAPAVFVAPDAAFGYPQAATASMVEDLRLYSLSLAIGTGLAIAGGPAVDPGPHGSLNGGEPGDFDPFTPIGLQLRKVDPAVTNGVLLTSSIDLEFDADVDPASINADRIVSSAGTPVQLSVAGRVVTVAPLANWATEENLRVLPGILSTSGAALGAALVVPVLPR